MKPTQTVPAQSDVQQVLYSANFVDVRSSDLASHRMEPWYKECAKITVNGLFTDNEKLTSKIPRNPTLLATPNLVSSQVAEGPVGVMVNGITIANPGDGSGCDTAPGKDAGVTGGGVTGNQADVWIRCATGAEGPILDAGFGHPASSAISSMTT